MGNPFRQLENIVQTRKIDREDLVHALMATVYSTCCEECAHTLRSDDFMKTFDHMATEMILCVELSKRIA